MNKSIPTSTSVEFVSLTPLNPLISKCEIKVLYTGLNRNRSFITKDVANKMAQSLPGTPIVGEFLTQDFGDHGEEDLVIDENGLRFVKSTVPYGFIPTDAKIWWQNFLDCDGVEREYLLTEGYLWTGRYPETQRVISKGNGQSMELDRDSLVGEWTKSDNAEFEYFNIDEAFFSALCILGEDVEPCFEGANIGRPGLLYSLDKDDFKSQLSAFMLDLKDALNTQGGIPMEDNKSLETPLAPEVEVEEAEVVEETTEIVEEVEVEAAETESADAEVEEFAKDDKKKKKEEEKEEEQTSEEQPSNDKQEENTDEEDKKKKKKNYKLEEVEEYVQLSKDFLELSTKYENLVEEYEAMKPVLEKFQAQENERVMAEKQEMINRFYMLDEADLKEVKENIANFSLDEIESKLCVIAVRKKVNFNLDTTENSDKEIEKPITTFNMGTVVDSTPAWLKAVESRTRK